MLGPIMGRLTSPGLIGAGGLRLLPAEEAALERSQLASDLALMPRKTSPSR